MNKFKNYLSNFDLSPRQSILATLFIVVLLVLLFGAIFSKDEVNVIISEKEYYNSIEEFTDSIRADRDTLILE